METRNEHVRDLVGTFIKKKCVKKCAELVEKLKVLFFHGFFFRASTPPPAHAHRVGQEGHGGPLLRLVAA